MILNDTEIMRLVKSQNMIVPFSSKTRVVGSVENSRKVLSYGLGYFGYDIRLGSTFKKLNPSADSIDPKTIVENDYEKIDVDDCRSFYLIPGESVLASSIEYFDMPADVMGICVGKSTYARCGLLVNVTPLEPGWCGNLTLELTNLNKQHSIKLYVNEGIAQIIFYRGILPMTSYVGNYQNQTGVTISKV